MVEVLVQNHKIGLEKAVVILDVNGNIVSSFGGGGGGLTDAQLRAASVAVSTGAADAGLVALATAIAGASPKTLDDLFAKDFATQTTLAALVTELAQKVEPSDLAGLATQVTAAAVLAKLSADPATQTTTAAILAKLSADPATQTTLAAALTQLQAIAANTDGLELKLDTLDINTDSIEAALTGMITELGQKLEAGDVTGLATSAKQDTLIAKDFATQTTLAALLAKVIATPATEAKQDTQITAEQAILAKLTADPATQTTLAAVLAKLSADPATQTTLAAVLAKIIAAPATEAKQDTGNTSLSSIDTNVAKTIPATTANAVTPSDATVLVSRAVWVGGAGDLSVRLSGAPSTTVVFTAVPAGTLLPISVTRVMAASTATNINVLA